MENAERVYHNQLANHMRPYIMGAKKEQGIAACEKCGSTERPEVNHKRYGENVTLNDLELLCRSCHAQQTGWAEEMSNLGSYCSHCQRLF